VECGFVCTDGTNSLDECESTCGDGEHAFGEGCDDGNLDNGDGCSSSCVLEDGYTTSGSVCQTTVPIRANANICVTKENCKCSNLHVEPHTIIGWPVDECNSCVIQGDESECNAQGEYYEDEGITYFLYIEGTDMVTSNTMAVVKLKNSLPYNQNEPDSTGVQYPHLSIRGFDTPVCLGCYTNGRGGNADFKANACAACSNSLKIFFFQLTAMAMNSEIAVDETTPNPLQVNFEFSIGGVLYVTPITKSLSQLSAGVNSGGTNRQHDLYNTIPTASEEFKWPKIITIDAKRFGVVCSFDTPDNTDCPYEGLESTSLQITATSDNVARRTVYTFRTIAGGELHVRMDAFHIGACPNTDASIQQDDFLQIVQYTATTGQRSPTRYDQNTVITGASTTTWTLSADLDQLQIIIANDGNNCATSNNFDMHFKVQNTIFPTTDPSPCTAGNHGTPGSCQVCASGSYKPGFGVGNCLECPDSKPVSAQGSSGIQQCEACAINSNKVANSNKDNCVCKPGYEITNGANGCSTCGLGFYKVEKGDATCDLCTNGATTGSEGSTRVDQCTCDTVRGYERDTTSTSTFLCEQVEITITRQFEIQMAFLDVSSNSGGVLTKFKEALAVAYSVSVDKITLSYYGKNDPNTKETVRRRRLLDADITIIESSVVAFRAISNTVTDQQMTTALSQKGIDNVEILARDYTAPPDGAVFNLLWIVAFCIVALVLVILIGWAWCVLYFRKQSETFQSLPQIAPARSEIVFVCDAAYDAQHYSEPHHDSFLL